MLSRSQVREVDRHAIEDLGIPGVILMENAGRLCADHVEKFLKKDPSRESVAIVAGVGNNGGDGYVIARHLFVRGYNVSTFVIVPREKISGDAKINLDALISLEQDVRFITESQVQILDDLLDGFDVVLDAIGGTGIAGPLRGTPALAVEKINSSNKPVIAVDIPTGLDCDEGTSDGLAIKAQLTVTFVDTKQGFENPIAKKYTGEVVVADIGIPPQL